MKKYTWYSDAGHGWLAVKRQDLHDLGISKVISRFSYERGQTVFLEEDCDALKFVATLRGRGLAFEYESIDHGDKSNIRSLPRYQAAL